MGRRAKPYCRRGWFVTSVDGKQHQKLCREAEGIEVANLLLTALMASRKIPTVRAGRGALAAESQSRLHLTWFNVLRCHYDFATPVYEEWFNSFFAFKDWSLANGYVDGLTIQRNDTSQGFFPENCRWTENKGEPTNVAFEAAMFAVSSLNESGQLSHPAKLETRDHGEERATLSMASEQS